MGVTCGSLACGATREGLAAVAAFVNRPSITLADGSGKFGTYDMMNSVSCWPAPDTFVKKTGNCMYNAMVSAVDRQLMTFK